MARSWKVNLIVASILAFSIFLGFGLIIPIFPHYVEELGGGATEIGILLGAFMFTRSFLARPFGKLSDRIGRKAVILTGMFLYALLAYLFTLPDSWWGLIFVRVMQGTASAMVWPVGEALVVDSAPPTKRSSAISTYILLSNIGFVAGPLIGASILFVAREWIGLSDLATIRTPFYFTSALAFIAAIFGVFFLENKLRLKKIEEQRKREKEAYASLTKRTKLSLKMLYTNSFFEGFSWSMAAGVMALFMEYNFGMDYIEFSILFGMALGLSLVVVKITGGLPDRYGRKPFIVQSSIWGRIATIVMSFSPLFPLGQVLAIVTYALKDMGRMIAQPATRALQADLVPTRVRGRMIATIQAISNVGATIGPVLGGIIWDLSKKRTFDLLILDLPGYSVPFLLSSIAGIIAALLVHRFVHEPRKKKPVTR